MKKNRRTIKRAIESVIPIILGYLPVAIAYGVLARSTELSLLDTGLFSALVYAGASQFMALDLLMDGIGAFSIILTTFLINLRHLVMSASIARKFSKIPRSQFPFLAFGITDETFSMLSFTEEELSPLFVFLVNGVAYSVWVIGTIAGFLLGEILPDSLQASLGIGLYGSFVALLVPQFRGKRKNLLVSILAVVSYLLISQVQFLTMGWDIVLSILISAALGLLILNREVELDD